MSIILTRSIFSTVLRTITSFSNPISLKSNSRSLHLSPISCRHPGIQYPSPLGRQWAVKQVIDPDQYTVDALRKVRTGGRGPDGKIQYKHHTTGLNRPWFMVDYNHSRHILSGVVQEEIVLEIIKNWWRTHSIALVATGEVKRWIVATSNMQPGDIVRSYVDIPLIPVNPRDGDSHPVGALPVGTTVCLIELHPGDGAIRCRAAGTSATVIRRGKLVGDPNAEVPKSDELLSDEHIIILRDNSSRKLMKLRPECVVVVGQVSNIEHNKERYSKFGEKNWRGIKQRSGLWQRKTGRFGRKIRPLGPAIDFTSPDTPLTEFKIKCTRPTEPELTRSKCRSLFNQMSQQTIRQPRIQPKPQPHTTQPHHQPLFCWSNWAKVR